MVYCSLHVGYVDDRAPYSTDGSWPISTVSKPSERSLYGIYGKVLAMLECFDERLQRAILTHGSLLCAKYRADYGSLRL